MLYAIHIKMKNIEKTYEHNFKYIYFYVCI